MPSRRGFIQTNLLGLGLAFAGRAALQAAFSPTTETVLPREEHERDYWNDWPRYLTAKTNEARSRRLAELSAMQTGAAVRARIEKIQSTVWRLIGGPFEKTPLKPQIIGTIDTLARKGYMVLPFDPFGQGERLQYLDVRTGKSLYGPTGEHDQAGRPMLLLGSQFAQYRVWDGIRALD